MKKQIGKILKVSVPLTLMLACLSVRASDHDDGETDIKSRNLSLTDLYVFKESDQIAAGDKSLLVFIMNTNPRSLPKQQYYFSSKARYEFHVSRAGKEKDSIGTTNDHVILRFEFGEPNTTAKTQTIKLTTLVDGTATEATTTGTTTPIGAAVTSNSLKVGSTTFTVFAGLREDPFFFDVTSYFKLRADIATAAGDASKVTVTFPATSPTDFTKDYNVNSIVVRAPIAFFQSSAGDTVFDVWETISVPK